MLIQFAVENFLSFRDKTVLSMVASDDTRHPSHVVTLPDGTRVLRCAALYGANASGKSNLMKALGFFKHLINEGVRPGKSMIVLPFKLGGTSNNAETKYEIDLWFNNARYSYGIVVTQRAILSEWLFRADSDGEKMIFERELAGRETRIKFGEMFVGLERQRMELVAQNTRLEQPFLVEAEEKNLPWALGPWFRDRMLLVLPSFEMRKLLPKLVHDVPELGPFLANYLRGVGTGITGLRAEREERSDRDKESYRLFTERLLSGGESIDFALAEESDGTQRLLDLLPFLFMAKENRSLNLLAIDELERSLHPLLTRQFLRDYLSLEANVCQLLFTTHDTDLLDLGLLRPDEIWFAEKDAEHASRLYSLAEFKPEQLAELGDRLEDGYLNGRFGAIPFLGTREQLGLPVRPTPPAVAPDKTE